jgi:hypothetical protein
MTSFLAPFEPSKRKTGVSKTAFHKKKLLQKMCVSVWQKHITKLSGIFYKLSLFWWKRTGLTMFLGQILVDFEHFWSLFRTLFFWLLPVIWAFWRRKSVFFNKFYEFALTLLFFHFNEVYKIVFSTKFNQNRCS